MELKAKVIQSLGIKTGTKKDGSPWSKADLIVEYGDQYPKKVCISNLRHAEQFAAIPPGTVASFSIDLDSREYNGKWYTSVTCYKWELPQTQPQAAPQMQVAPPLDGGANAVSAQPQQSQTYTPPAQYGQQPQQPPLPLDDDNQLPF